MFFYTKSLYRHRPAMAKILLVMRLIIVLITAAIMQVSAAGYAQKVTLIQSNARLSSVLDEIRKQTGYDFVYSDKAMSSAKRVTINLKSAELKDALTICFKDQPLSFKMEDKMVIIKPKDESLLNTANSPIQNVIARFQSIDVKGKVVDSLGHGIGGATVTVKGTKQVTSTLANGDFFLKNVEESAVLVVSYLGYLTKEMSVNKEFNYVQLQLSSSKLDEVQVVGYGQTSQRLYTGNVGKVTAAEIDRQNVNNPILALTGRIPGIEIDQVNGLPGGAVKVNIRGMNSLNQNTEPLYIVDGVAYPSNVFASNPGYNGLNASAGINNPLSWLNPADIESISVLKDAVSTAIYGSRGSNGVILIKTKKGVAGAAKLDFNLQSGIGQVSRKAKFMNTQEYLEMRREAFANDGIDVSALTPDFYNADLTVWDQNAYTDWQDVMIGGTAKYHNFQSAISGGTENTQYRLAGGYKQEGTVFPGDWDNRKGSMQFNINSTSTNRKFKFSLSGTYLNDLNRVPTIDFTKFINLSPNAPSFYKADGSLDWDTYPNNPFKINEIDYESRSTNIVSGASLSYQILKGLEVKTDLSFNSVLLNERTAGRINSNSPTSGITTASAAFNTLDLKTWVIEPQINYQIPLHKGAIRFLTGGTIQKRQTSGQEIYAGGYTDDSFTKSLSGATSISKGPSTYEHHKFNSVFARINVEWAQKYLLELSGRRDGSSRFGPGKQFGNFGAIGAGWIFSEEKGIKDMIPALSQGKFRMSYGSSGNEPSQNYQFLELFGFSNTLAYGGGFGFYPRNLPDANFRWETNRKFEAGLELGFLQDKLLLTASVFRNRTSNQLSQLPLPASIGFESILANIPAVIQNQGVELTLNTTNIKSRNFQWQSNFNITVARNKLIEYDNFEISGYQGVYAIGRPISIRRQYLSAGLNQTTGLYQFFDQNLNITERPSYWSDRTNYANLDRSFYGGIQNTLIYKDFSLDLNFQFVRQKGEDYLFSNRFNPGNFNVFDPRGNQPIAVKSRWQADETGSKYQKYSQTVEAFDAYEYAKGSNMVVSDASFLRLKNLSVSYTVSEPLIRKLKMDRVRLFLQAQNLLTISGYKGIDPETKSITALPPLRVIMAGFQFTL